MASSEHTPPAMKADERMIEKCEGNCGSLFEKNEKFMDFSDSDKKKLPDQKICMDNTQGVNNLSFDVVTADHRNGHTSAYHPRPYTVPDTSDESNQSPNKLHPKIHIVKVDIGTVIEQKATLEDGSFPVSGSQAIVAPSVSCSRIVAQTFDQQRSLPDPLAYDFTKMQPPKKRYMMTACNGPMACQMIPPLARSRPLADQCGDDASLSESDVGDGGDCVRSSGSSQPPLESFSGNTGEEEPKNCYFSDSDFLTMPLCEKSDQIDSIAQSSLSSNHRERTLDDYGHTIKPPSIQRKRPMSAEVAIDFKPPSRRPLSWATASATATMAPLEITQPRSILEMKCSEAQKLLENDGKHALDHQRKMGVPVHNGYSGHHHHYVKNTSSKNLHNQMPPQLMDTVEFSQSKILPQAVPPMTAMLANWPHGTSLTAKPNISGNSHTKVTAIDVNSSDSNNLPSQSTQNNSSVSVNPKALIHSQELKSLPQGELLQEALCKWRWVSIDNIQLPGVFRDSEHFVAVHMVQMRLLAKFPPNVPNDIMMRYTMSSHKMTVTEAWIFNTVNLMECMYEFGYQLFTTNDEVVRFADVEQFYWAVKFFNLSRMTELYRAEIRAASTQHLGLTAHISELKGQADAELKMMHSGFRATQTTSGLINQPHNQQHPSDMHRQQSQAVHNAYGGRGSIDGNTAPIRRSTHTKDVGAIGSLHGANNVNSAGMHGHQRMQHSMSITGALTTTTAALLPQSNNALHLISQAASLYSTQNYASQFQQSQISPRSAIEVAALAGRGSAFERQGGSLANAAATNSLLSQQQRYMAMAAAYSGQAPHLLNAAAAVAASSHPLYSNEMVMAAAAALNAQKSIENQQHSQLRLPFNNRMNMPHNF